MHPQVPLAGKATAIFIGESRVGFVFFIICVRGTFTYGGVSIANVTTKRCTIGWVRPTLCNVWGVYEYARARWVTCFVL